MVLTGQWVAGAVAVAFAGLGLVFFVKKAALPRPFVTRCLAVFLAVFGLGTFVTAVMPDSYLGLARIKVGHELVAEPGSASRPGYVAPYDPYFVQTEFEVLQSEVILTKVIQNLNLAGEWKRRYAGGAEIPAIQMVNLLRARIDLRTVRNTSLIEIRVYGENPDEPAKIANMIAQVYQEYRAAADANLNRQSHAAVEIVDRAMPLARPVRPNKPLNVAIAALLGMALGIPAGLLRKKAKG